MHGKKDYLERFFNISCWVVSISLFIFLAARAPSIDEELKVPYCTEVLYNDIVWENAEERLSDHLQRLGYDTHPCPQLWGIPKGKLFLDITEKTTFTTEGARRALITFRATITLPGKPRPSYTEQATFTSAPRFIKSLSWVPDTASAFTHQRQQLKHRNDWRRIETKKCHDEHVPVNDLP